MGFLDKLRSSRDERATERDTRLYRTAVDEWLQLCTTAVDYAVIARRPATAPGGVPLQLWKGEQLLMWWTGGELIAPKNARVTTWTSASYRVGQRTRVRAGAARSTITDDRPSPIDRGAVAVTDQRVVFLGSTRTIDWQFRRLIGMTHDSSGRWTALHVSNRRRVHGFGYPRAHHEEVRFYLALALAIYSDSHEDFVADLARQVDEVLARPPAPPAGVTEDPRVQELHPISERHQLAPAVMAAPAPGATTTRQVGFASTSPEAVSRGLQLVGFFTSVDIEGSEPWEPTRLETDLRPKMLTENRQWVAVVAGGEGFIARYLDGLSLPTLVAACAPSQVLDDLGLPVIDEEEFEPFESGYCDRDADAVEQQLQAEGYNVVKACLNAQSAPDLAPAIDAATRVARFIQAKPQAVVVQGPETALRQFLGTMTGVDTIVVCAEGITLDHLGVSIVTTEASGGDGAPPALASAPITVAGRLVTNPAAGVAAYLRDHGGTVVHYDLFDGSRDAVDLALVRATRSPWMNSRISADEADWFIKRAVTAPWDLVEPTGDLADADPTEVGGLYDRASELYGHFFDEAPRGVSVAKVSKVLHLMRPRFFPILDSRLMEFYESAARDAAKEASRTRPGLSRFKRLHWAAVRRDILENRQALKELRSVLAAASEPLAAAAAEHVGDVRLLDMLAWAAAEERLVEG